MRSFTAYKLATAAALLSLLVGARAALAASAQISPSRITLDEAATLRIESDDGATQPPNVAGLRFRRAGQSSEMTIINGAVSKHTFVDYEVAATHAGTYAIPIDGQTLQLEVAAAASSPIPTARATANSAPETSLAFMRVALPAHVVYVGQSVPITFKAYFRAGTEVTLTAAPSLGIPAFTVSQLSEQPRQSVENLGGVPYRVATWTAQVSAAMPGHYATNATLPIIARYREAPTRQAADPFAGMLDDQDPFNTSALLQSFMNRSAFGGDLFGEVRQRELTLRAHEQPLEVAALPTAGQPADFSGAVGHFDVRASLASTVGATAEPLSLKIEVSGRGNFDRVATRGVQTSSDWKTYPPGAGVITDGSKVFEQAVVPRRAGRVEVPAISLSFFDPDRGQYVTRSTAPISVQVSQTESSAANASPSATSAPSTIGAVDALRPNHGEQTPRTAGLERIRSRSLFWIALATPVLALALWWLRGRERTPSTRTRLRASRSASAARRAEMKRAAAVNDSVRYFAVARTALQASLAERWHVAPDEVSSADVESRMGAAGAPIAATLKAAEQLIYAGVAPEVGSLTSYDRIVEQQLDQLEI